MVVSMVVKEEERMSRLGEGQFGGWSAGMVGSRKNNIKGMRRRVTGFFADSPSRKVRFVSKSASGSSRNFFRIPGRGVHK